MGKDHVSCTSEEGGHGRLSGPGKILIFVKGRDYRMSFGLERLGVCRIRPESRVWCHGYSKF